MMKRKKNMYLEFFTVTNYKLTIWHNENFILKGSGQVFVVVCTKIVVVIYNPLNQMQ